MLAPENEKVASLNQHIKNYDDVVAYQQKTALRSEFDRLSQQKDKTGCRLDGLYAINPLPVACRLPKGS